VTVITGDPQIPTSVSVERVVAVGQCVPKERRGKYYVKGCPPCNSWVVQGIIGERGVAKRMYATDGDLEATDKDKLYTEDDEEK